jgi:hypothetical protein
MSEIQELLRAAQRVIEDVKAKQTEGAGFNVFRLCGVDHYETMHSKILAEFLSPQGSHGQGECFLEAFSGKLKEWFRFDGSFTKAATVSTEITEYIKDERIGRVDIILEDKTTKSACIIENKIYAGEQPDQLDRYAKWLEKERAGWKTSLIFLTLNGKAAWSIKDCRHYERLAYVAQSSNVPRLIDWIAACCDKVSGNLKSAFEQYRDLVINLAEGDAVMEKELMETIRSGAKTGMMAAAEAVFNDYIEIKRCFIRGVMEDVREEVGLPAENCAPALAAKKPGYAFTFNVGDQTFKLWCAWDYKLEASNACLYIGIYNDHFKYKKQLSDFNIWRDRNWEELAKRQWDYDGEWPLWKWFQDQFGNTPFWDGKFLDKLNGESTYRKMLVSMIANDIKELYKIAQVFRQAGRL